MNDITPPSVFLRNISFSYSQKIIFNKLSFHLEGGKTTCLLGTSGSGKTTLLRLIANFIAPIHYHSQHDNIIECANNKAVHQQISYIPQEDLLLPWLTVLDNILIGLKLKNTNKSTFIDKKNKAKFLLEKVGLTHCAQLFPHQLSGGMKQRVSLVRALIEDQPIVLMDEPFSSLDVITRLKLQNLMIELLNNKTILLVTHDPLEALRLADVVHILGGSPSNIVYTMEINSQKPRSNNASEFNYLHNILLNKLIEICE